MVTASKRWAILAGAGVVGVAIVTGALVSRRPAEEPAEPLGAPAPMQPAVVARAPVATPVVEAARGAPIPPPAGETPHFDVVRVEPNGDTVLAGQGTPNATVDLLASGTVVAQASTDASGHFVMLPALKPGDYALTLRQPGAGAAVVTSTQSVVVSVPAKGQGSVVVALAEPGQATKLLSAPPVASTAPTRAEPAKAATADRPATSNKAALAVRSVELENGNGFYASGVATPGTKLHVYLNNSPLADVIAGAEAAWSVKIKKGLTGGHYVVRADAVPDGTHVTARVEVPFDVPVAMADVSVPALKPLLAAAAAQPAAIPSGTASDVVVDEIKTAIVRDGDSLWDISRVRLGDGRRYTTVYAANMSQIRDPNLIYPGQVFVLPARVN